MMKRGLTKTCVTRIFSFFFPPQTFLVTYPHYSNTANPDLMEFSSPIWYKKPCFGHRYHVKHHQKLPCVGCSLFCQRAPALELDVAEAVRQGLRHTARPRGRGALRRKQGQDMEGTMPGDTVPIQFPQCALRGMLWLWGKAVEVPKPSLTQHP